MQRLQQHSVGEDLPIYGRVAKPDGTWGDTDNVQGITAIVKRIGAAAENIDLVAEIATLMFDELIEGDPAFTRDWNDARETPGYNFAWEVPAARFAGAGWHTIQINFTFDTGEITKLLWEVPVVDDVS